MKQLFFCLTSSLLHTFATTHAFCASWDGPRCSYLIRAVHSKVCFVLFMTMRQNKILATAIENQKEN